MALTKNPIIKRNDTEFAALEKTANPYDKTARKIQVAEAQKQYELTGDVKPLENTLQTVKEKTLGGSIDRYNIDTKIQGTKEQEYQRKVDVAAKAYKDNPNDVTAADYQKTIAEGKNIYSAGSETGLKIDSAIKNVSGSEISRTTAAAKANWQNDPETYKDEYKAAIQKQIDYYGKDSSEAVTLKQNLRKVDEESLLYGVRSAKLAYTEDPENNYEALVNAEKKLVDFYGSSSDGYYASKALITMDETESERLDTEASAQYQTGAIGFEGYHNYLNAQMSKYDEGSTQYLKYYKASKDLEFKNTLDTLVRSQYDSEPGDVIKNMKSSQAAYAVGSTAYNSFQDQIDTLTQNLRYTAYKEMVKSEVKERSEEINSLQVKLYLAEQDFANGKISESKYKKLYKNYNNKIDYLGDSNTLPSFEIWNSYGVS